MTKTEARWISIPLGTAALAEQVATLRCGLDREGLWSWAGRAGRWLAKGERCRALKPEGLGADEPLPFDLRLRTNSISALLAPFADLIKDKSLIIVPSGPLTSLPFHVLVTAKPSPSGLADYRTPAWLALKQPITVLPSVGSLQALRKLPPSQAKEPYIAFGNPLLGAEDDEQAKLARAKQKCPQDLDSLRQRAVAAAKDIPGFDARSSAAAASTLMHCAHRRPFPRPPTNCARWPRRWVRWEMSATRFGWARGRPRQISRRSHARASWRAIACCISPPTACSPVRVKRSSRLRPNQPCCSARRRTAQTPTRWNMTTAC